MKKGKERKSVLNGYGFTVTINIPDKILQYNNRPANKTLSIRWLDVYMEKKDGLQVWAQVLFY